MKMKYYQIMADENYVPPVPIGWYGKLDGKTLEEKKSYEMPKHLLFQTERHMQMVFTDIVVFPCFMVSRTVRDVIVRYEPHINFTRIILYDKEKKCSKAYYLPFLKSEGQAEKNRNGSISVKEELLSDKTVIRMDGMDRTYIVMRMDLVESILRRETVGVGLREVTIL